MKRIGLFLLAVVLVVGLAGCGGGGGSSTGPAEANVINAWRMNILWHFHNGSYYSTVTCNGSVTLVLFDDGTADFTSTKTGRVDASGPWVLDGRVITASGNNDMRKFCVGVRATYVGTVSADGASITGTMSNVDGNGVWSATLASGTRF